MNSKKNILISGGDSRFCKFLKKTLFGKNVTYYNKKKLNIDNYNNICQMIKKHKVDIFIHIAALSRPMNIHNKDIDLSIKANIIGTANVVRACKKFNVKLIYFSTNYVYPCTKGNYSESQPLSPINNYGWAKLGGECAVQMYKNSLILRLALMDYPFPHKSAIKNSYSSLIYNKDFAKILPLILNEVGILNIGGKRKTIFNFAKKNNPNIKKIDISEITDFPVDSSLNTDKYKEVLKKIFKVK
tara:strand:+ start:1011 stop:1739 length:729 start_codon:yes stop_codon:yes gene_type:complete